MSGERVVTEEQLEALVAKRLRERAEFINEAVAALRPEIEAMTKQIAAANHVKKELGGQISELATLVKATNSKLELHAMPPSHEVIGATFRELGVDQMSLEQKQVLGEITEQAVRTRDNRVELDRRSDRRRSWIQLGLTFVATLVGAAVGALSIGAAFGFRHP